jgi:hypothetical protein
MSLEKLNKFSEGFETSLQLHITVVEKLRSFFTYKNVEEDHKDILDGIKEDVFNNLVKIEDYYKKFIIPLNPISIRHELDRQFSEQFGEEEKEEKLVNYIRMKIYYEFLSSFLKGSLSAWENIHGFFKILTTYPTAKYVFDNLYREYFFIIQTLNQDMSSLLKLIEKKFSCSIIGSSPQDSSVLVSNMFYDEELDYSYKNLFSKPTTSSVISTTPKPVVATTTPETRKTVSVSSSKANPDFYHTEIKGTKDWNQNDSYVLFIQSKDLVEEQKKFYTSSFVTLNPSENLNINLAAALVRRNSGQALASKYTKMIQTLLEFIINNLFLKDFPYVTDDIHAFLYHIGPVVVYNIIVEDMNRRDFGFCHYVDNNRIIKLFPDVILKKHIIDYWADHFFDLKQDSVDSYINFSKGVSNIKESYKNFFDYAASTRKRGMNEKQSIEDYMRENVAKFFGYRRAQVFRRFVPDSVFGSMPEVSSTELVKKFK